ncbi:MAG: cytochrome c biogenesis protein CcsA [Oceanospirillaceae bacterium]|nr:cytochrome c biogenesis protein CcsA [Oceanospirillaceae bacterium]MCP5349651.1 cytochrome c biogenesis protein CcsA [Oceanospirillaceae bacterium]
MANLLAVSAILLYSFAALLQFRRIRGHQGTPRNLLMGSAAAAVLCHSAAWFMPIFSEHGMNFSLFNGGSLIALAISAIVLISAIKKPVENLFIGIFPMTALVMAMDLFIPGNHHALEHFNRGLLAHILLSVLAYSLLTIAAFQGILVIIQDQQLKRKHVAGILRSLPPLQTMDKLMFEMIWAGMIFLTLAIGSGFVFLDNMFAQHLAHKTLLSIIGWCIFAALLLGRYRFGWRGQTASIWTLSGLGLLALAYFGSKLVLEFIISSH